MSQANLSDNDTSSKLNLSESDQDDGEISISSESIEIHYLKSQEKLEESESRNSQIQDRIKLLKSNMEDFKEQIQMEKKKWQDELREILKIQKLQKMQQSYQVNNYYLSNDIEDEVQAYEDAIVRARASNLATYDKVTKYKQRLYEVERMCSIELNRIKRQVRNLRQLQMMDFYWDLKNSINLELGDGDSESLISNVSGDKIKMLKIESGNNELESELGSSASHQPKLSSSGSNLETN